MYCTILATHTTNNNKEEEKLSQVTAYSAIMGAIPVSPINYNVLSLSDKLT